MTLDDERELLKIIRYATRGWLVLAVAAVVIGALTDKSPWWLAPMVWAIVMVASEWRQEIRVRNLEKRQQQ